MPVTGAKPKPPGEAVHRNKPAHEWTEVEDTPNDECPHRLPRRRPNGDEWLEATVQKWRAWRTMPHTRLWNEGDWQFCLDSVEVAARFHEGSLSAGTELRSREKVMGTTMDARRDLRIRYVDPKPSKPSLALVSNDDFRSL